jgi:hypothetical protein
MMSSGALPTDQDNASIEEAYDKAEFNTMI